MLFFINNKGILGAATGHNDDRVMAASVNIRIIEDTPNYRNVNINGRRKVIHDNRDLQFVPQYKEPRKSLQQRSNEALRRYM